VHERDPERRAVLLSVYEDEQYLFQAMRAGASGYLLKRISGEELVGGHLHVRSRPGAGRTVTVTVPLRSPSVRPP
jgi:DNA-binding NarL/FixJ family response regulator